MDIESVVARQDVKRVLDESERKIVFVMPSTGSLPDDGVLVYSVLESIYDWKSTIPGSVVQVPSDKIDLLVLTVENQIVFGVSLKALTGVPTADYDLPFDQAIWSLDRVSYAPLLSELALDLEVERQTEIANETQHDRERRQVTRSDGSIKEHTTFALAGADDSELDDA